MKRPPKPRISKNRLVWKWNKSKNSWEPYYRVTWMDDAGKRREKCILLKWHGEPQLLDDLYWQCEAGGHERQQRKAPKYTWGELVQLWKSDPVEQQNLAASTRRGYLRDLELILAKNANMDMRKTTKQALRTAHQSLADTTRKADKLLTIVSKMWNYACDTQDWPLGPKPTKGIKRFGKQKSFEPWPQWMIDKPPTAPEIVHTGAELILGTGQRPAAAFAMQHDDFSDEWRRVIDEKSDERFETYCPEQLRKFVARCPRKGKFILAKNLTEAVGYDAVEKAFREWRSTLAPRQKSSFCTACASWRFCVSQKPVVPMLRSKPSPTRALRWSPTTGRKQAARFFRSRRNVAATKRTEQNKKG